MLESKVQKDVMLYLRDLGYMVFKLDSPTTGVPDLFCARAKGDSFFVECKRPGKGARKIQEFRHEQLRSKGQVVYVFDSLDICKNTIK